MSAREEIVQAATRALQRYADDPGRRRPATFRGYAEAVVDELEPLLLAAERARIAAAIRDAGHPDGYHRVDTTREWAGIYCADCAVTERSARIAETAPEEEQ